MTSVVCDHCGLRLSTHTVEVEDRAVGYNENFEVCDVCDPIPGTVPDTLKRHSMT
jgi:hypothetical protein